MTKPAKSANPISFRRNSEVKGSVTPYGEEFLECLGEMAQYLYNTYGKFPATIPSILVAGYVQAQHIDTEFYDTHFQPGAYLSTHVGHMERWHDERSQANARWACARRSSRHAGEHSVGSAGLVRDAP